MRYRGVLFDLYGTLVPPFRKQEHIEAIAECARLLHVSRQDLQGLFNADYLRRIRGEVRSASENFAAIARSLGADPSLPQLEKAKEVFLRFVAEGLEPVPQALPLLGALRDRGLRLGLCSNCAGEVPRLVARSELAPFFQGTAFSSELGMVKPEPGIYEAALAAMGCTAKDVLYVGDGSDGELTGAAACGMHPVLVEVDLSNTYDAERDDVRAWQGDRVAQLAEITRFL
ncbi:MAG: HAD family hydrolase [Thermaerobacter sp.]|nr:HAD family hydrolase [Thermaerobacter sp.]